MNPGWAPKTVTAGQMVAPVTTGYGGKRKGEAKRAGGRRARISNYDGAGHKGGEKKGAQGRRSMEGILKQAESPVPQSRIAKKNGVCGGKSKLLGRRRIDERRRPNPGGPKRTRGTENKNPTGHRSDQG